MKLNALYFGNDSSLQETLYLLSSKKNREHLKKSLKEAREGKTVWMPLLEE